MNTEYPEKYTTLGLKIAYYRKKAGYTQETFAEKIGKSVKFLAQVEGTGTVRGIPLETLFKIADCLSIPPSKLLEDDRPCPAAATISTKKSAFSGGFFICRFVCDLCVLFSCRGLHRPKMVLMTSSMVMPPNSSSTGQSSSTARTASGRNSTPFSRSTSVSMPRTARKSP